MLYAPPMQCHAALVLDSGLDRQGGKPSSLTSALHDQSAEKRLCNSVEVESSQITETWASNTVEPYARAAWSSVNSLESSIRCLERRPTRKTRIQNQHPDQEIGS